MTYTICLQQRPASSGNGIRTRVPALRGLCPSPLDDTAEAFAKAHASAMKPFPVASAVCARSPFVPVRRETQRTTVTQKQARRESNPQPPVLETGALPIELRTSGERRHHRCSPVRLRVTDGN